MKGRMRIIMMTVFLIAGVVLIAYYIFHQREVSFEFVRTMKIPGNTDSPLTFYYTPSQERLKYWMFDYRIENNQPVIENIDLGMFDFEKYDYLLFFGKKLLNLRYSPWLTYSEDECHYLKETPLFSTLEDDSIDKLYIYRISKTNKFRSPCP